MADRSIKIAENHFEKHSYLNNANYALLRYFPKCIWRKWQRIQIECLKKVERFVVLTYEDEKQWFELDNITVIPNPLTFIPEHKSFCNSKQVIAVGRYVNQKGFDLLISAWQMIASKHQDWTLKIYGDGPLRERLQRKVIDAGLSDSCKLEFPVKDIAAKYADEVIVLSEKVQKYFKKFYDRDTVLIPNGVMTHENRKANLITQKFGLHKDEYICALSRLTEEKGIHFLIEAYKLSLIHI